MISFGFDGEDLQELTLDLGNLDPKKLGKDEFPNMVKDVVNYVKEYPPPKPKSKYIRTRRLFRSWGMKFINPLEIMVINTAKDPDTEEYYANFVSGIDQREMHKETGWRNIYTSAHSWFTVFVRRLNGKIDKIWNTDGI